MVRFWHATGIMHWKHFWQDDDIHKVHTEIESKADKAN